MTVAVPSPAISIVGRHNSGKTTLIERLIAELTSRGLDVGTVKHHSHVGFEIDVPGKDSFRHRAAGASETIIAAPGQIARVKSIDGEIECADILKTMPNHDIVIVEGYRKSGLPTIEIMRSGNDADSRVADVFIEGAHKGWPLGTDFTQLTRGIQHIDEAEDHEIAATAKPKEPEIDTGHFTVHAPDRIDISNKLPTAKTVAVVTDIPDAIDAAGIYGVAAFDLNDVVALADFVQEHYVRPHLSVVIQAGGESRRMGRSKATVPFAGRPLISRLVERLSPVADELIITTNEPENLEFLHDEFPDVEVNLIRDVYNFRGALPGLCTAFEVASCPHVAVVACDMVFASPALIVAESADMYETGADAVVPVNQHGFEPFHAVYRRATCLPVAKTAVERGDKRAQALYDDVQVLEFPQARVLEAEPMGGCFINVNTPEELHNIESSFLDA